MSRDIGLICRETFFIRRPLADFMEWVSAAPETHGYSTTDRAGRSGTREVVSGADELSQPAAVCGLSGFHDDVVVPPVLADLRDIVEVRIVELSIPVTMT